MINRKKALLIGVCVISFGLTDCTARVASPPKPQAKVPSLKPNVVTGSYLIGPEDVLEIYVWKNQDLSTTTVVRPDGMISMALLGDIQASGKTPTELQNIITERLKEYQQEPKISVIVREANSYSFFILGEVIHPGKYTLKAETTVLQAIALAGGFSQWAEKDKVLIIRKALTQETDAQRITVRYKDIVSGKDDRANLYLKPGDTVVVP
ncbi:MAG: polysaccharide biosynthesis/export family protein [Nitrospirae bacterium]|nr:polysaccharide biosynthesis/export family protein [Nitrospirota bacterium]